MSKALVVDDEPNLRKVLAAMLKREGYDVSMAENGVQALAELKKNGADVVVTDQVMPQMGGLDLLRAVLADHPDVPVIMITAHGTVDSAVEAIKLGAFDYITKPFEQDELKAVIAKAVRTRDLGRNNIPPMDERARMALVGASPAMQDVFKILDK
ncbi:MAG: sigma-54-dependent transcriptional regulator, partial [Myxococcales bacterium]